MAKRNVAISTHADVERAKRNSPRERFERPGGANRPNGRLLPRWPPPSLASTTLLQLLHDLVQVEARSLLSLGVLLERHDELGNKVLRWHGQKRMIEQPVVVRVRCDVRPLVGIEAEVIDFWNSEGGKRIGPDQQRPGRSLLHEDELPVVVPEADELLVVVAVKE